MRIVLAPDKFKGSLNAPDVARSIVAGIHRVDSTIEIDSVPMADGGEGTVEALVRAMNGRFITRRVTGPLPEMKVDATFGLFESPQAGPSGPGPTVVIEMSSASGFALLKKDQLDPLATTTFGTGELIRIAIEEFGAKNIILGIGGSATIDGGIGAAQACGLPVILEGGEPVAMTEPLCGRDVERVVLVKHGRGDHLGGVEMLVACDVNNPLYGENGAAHVFGPQKGASPNVVVQLDAALKQLAQRTRHDDLAQTPGAGAAGGCGFGMLAFFGATLRPGADVVIEATNLSQRLIGTDLCITGEGQIDPQTLSGKVVQRVTQCCQRAGVKCIAIAGGVDQRAMPALRRDGLVGAFPLVDQYVTREDAITNPAVHLERVAEELARNWVLPKRSR